MKQTILTVAENVPAAAGTYRMRLIGDVSAVSAPGQFINLAVEGGFLRRPISVHDRTEDSVTILYKIMGRGTEALSRLRPGAEADVLTGLGNGFDLAAAGDAPLLIGGGIGSAPLYWLARELRAQGKSVSAVLGFNTASDVLCAGELRALGCAVTLTTADGSLGTRGFVTDALPEEYSYFYACGPEPMLRAVYRTAKGPGEFSLEERMGCGFGACMGCTCRTAVGYKRVCRDGPVFKKEELVWAD